MADSVEVDLMDSSKYRVAYDLMNRIAHTETATKDRQYWLNLYTQCRKVVLLGQDADSAMEGDDD